MLNMKNNKVIRKIVGDYETDLEIDSPELNYERIQKRH